MRYSWAKIILFLKPGAVFLFQKSKYGKHIVLKASLPTFDHKIKAMLKIFSVSQVRQADARTISDEPIASVDLMERAASKCFDWIISKLGEKKVSFYIFCGPGNNGGDGLALARMLHMAHYGVNVAIPEPEQKFSDDFSLNLARLRTAGIEPVSYSEGLVWQPAEKDLIIDALFGSGLSKPAEGEVAGILAFINKMRSIVVSIDIPSGLFADKPCDEKSVVVQADYTLSFQFPKLAFFFPENEKYIGEWAVLPIGLSSGFILEEPCNNHFITLEDVRTLLKPRSRFAHKGNFGHALLISGSQGKMGAAVLASRACLRSGAGLTTAHIPQCGYQILQAAVPEAMVSLDPCMNECSRIPDLLPYSAIGIGPGLGRSKEATNTVRLILQESRVPLVMDADALNILSEQKTWQAFIPAGAILTPHPGEFERLAGKWNNGFEMLDLLRNYSLRHKVYVVLKGAFTITCSPTGNCFFNSTGNPGMASGGSGDALTGILLGLLAQRYDPLEACLLGVYLHGLAGDLAADRSGKESLIAGDIVEHLGDAFKRLY